MDGGTSENPREIGRKIPQGCFASGNEDLHGLNGDPETEGNREPAPGFGGQDLHEQDTDDEEGPGMCHSLQMLWRAPIRDHGKCESAGRN